MSDNLPSCVKFKNDVELGVDGVLRCSTIDQVVELMLDGHKPNKIFFVGPEVDKFNSKVPAGKEFSNGDQKPLSFEWLIPDYYKSLDVYSFLLSKLDEYTINFDDRMKLQYFNRVLFELEYFEESESFDFLRCIIYIVETFISRNIFWGVGRGSSCASLSLFLIGLHLVDPIKFNIPTTDFFK